VNQTWALLNNLAEFREGEAPAEPSERLGLSHPGAARQEPRPPNIVQTHLVLLLAATLCGCRGESDRLPVGPLRVAVSIIPQAWLVSEIGGRYVDVVALVQPGESHETYQPSDAQISRVMGGAAYFCIGMPFESGPAFANIRSQGKLRMVDMREGIELREIGAAERPAGEEASRGHPSHGHGHEHGGKDPHVWLSPKLLKIEARTVAKTLGELDPAHREAYDRNLAALNAKLDAADGEIHGLLDPLRGKTLFVFHPAWGYFADEYGLKQVAIEQEGKEPSDEEATALQRSAREHGAKVVFVQPQISSRGAEAVARAIGARVESLDPLAPDVLDNLVRAARMIAASYQ
jgi:zinc transport system substrate-binding protein